MLPEVWTYTCIKTITQTTNNTATVTAWTRGEDKLTASDSAVVTVGASSRPPQLGSLTITKVVNPAEDFRGETFTFDVSCAPQQTITLAAGEGYQVGDHQQPAARHQLHRHRGHPAHRRPRLAVGRPARLRAQPDRHRPGHRYRDQHLGRGGRRHRDPSGHAAADDHGR